MRTIKTVLVAVLAGAATIAGGCAKPQATSVEPARALVADRTGHSIDWDRSDAADRAVSDHVRQMLRQPLSADAAAHVALLNNRHLRATYEDVGVARAELVQAGLLKNPVFDAAIRFGEGGGGTGLELTLVQDFLDVFQIPMRKRAAGAALESARLRVAGAAIDLVAQVRAAFYQHQAATQAMEMRQTVLAATEASYDLARRLREAGNINELDLANEQASYEQAKLDVASAEAAVVAGRERLNSLLGLWGQDTTWAAAERLPDLPGEDMALERVEGIAVEKSLELALAREELRSAAQRLGLRRTFGLVPEVEIGATAERELEGGWSVGPAFALPVPLFDQGQAKVAVAGAELRRSRMRYAALAVDVRSAARAARDRLHAARQRAAYIRDVILPLRTRIVEQTQLQFNAMQVSPFQLLTTRQQQVVAGRQYIEALRDYWLARAQLEQIVSGRMPRIEANESSVGAALSSAGASETGGH